MYSVNHQRRDGVAVRYDSRLDVHPKDHIVRQVVPMSAATTVALPWLSGKHHSRAQSIAEQCILDIFGSPDDDLQDTSIYRILAERFHKCHPAHGDILALSPGPIIDETLHRLVDIIRGKPSEAVGARLSMAVDRLIVEQICSSVDLKRQAAVIRSAAGLAESAMEYYYAARLTRRLRRVRAGYRSRSLDTVLGVFDGFPYIDSYLELVKGEVSIFSSNTPKNIVVGGCGPLPITGLLYHVLTGAQVELVDNHPNAIAAAQELVSEMERLGILMRDAVRVRCDDIGALLIEPTSIPDVIMVASLVNDEAKYQLAESIKRAFQQGKGSPALLLRSAKGLCAELAYRPVDRSCMKASGLFFHGELVPCNHVVFDVAEPLAQEWGVMSKESSSILDVLPSSVLNSSELYTAETP